MSGQASNVVIPNDPVAKLMYYLSCINGIMPLNVSEKYLNHQHHQITQQERKIVLEVAKVLHPKQIIEAGLFELDSNHTSVPSNGNAFVRLNSDIEVETSSFSKVVADDVKIEHKMICGQEWLDTYYYHPCTMITQMTSEYRPVEAAVIKPSKSGKIYNESADEVDAAKSSKCC